MYTQTSLTAQLPEQAGFTLLQQVASGKSHDIDHPERITVQKNHPDPALKQTGPLVQQLTNEKTGHIL